MAPEVPKKIKQNKPTVFVYGTYGAITYGYSCCFFLAPTVLKARRSRETTTKIDKNKHFYGTGGAKKNKKKTGGAKKERPQAPPINK
jgi:hypothetical protein